ncbi:MAG: type II toxin-antitoxin system RelB/DinJ family antitoxin [Ardenticatenaceae bacterium]
MNDSAIVPIQIEPQLRIDAESVFRELGISVTEAITLFYEQVILNRQLPFHPPTPNPTTLETFRKTDAGEEIVSFNNTQELFEWLEI